ncbi:transcriptional regulator [beta proteobacterium AAP121]|nr:transcriptional regulator [beta proteobacterium AAP65]KPF97158.1 transcriptional regulator [beta proteobacterium AAP121]
MILPAVRWVPLLALMSCLLPGVVAAQSAALPPAEAKALLQRIRTAASTGNYQGTMVFSVSGTFSSSRVGHYSVGDQTYELLEALDGRQQRILRHNDAVHTLWPQAKVAVIEKRETRGAWSTTPQEVDPQALEHYELRREGEARIAGREATVLLLEPRDTLRYAQRLWADRATGLMLRADVVAQGAPGQERGVLESTAFSEINIGVRPQPDIVMQVLRNPRGLEGYRVVRPQQQRTELEAEGWALARPVAGFRLVGSVRRGMEAGGGGSAQVLQAVFSDGLTHVSLFAEPFQADRHRSELQAQQGATATVMLRRGEHWITVVGDVPLATLKLFANALERRAR